MAGLSRNPYQRAGLIGGAALFLVLLVLPAPEGLSPTAWRTAALAVLMGAWWITEALPLPATALLPVVLLPVMGILPVKAATSPYANPLIFLFLGGFLLALAMERWNLHKRLALWIVHLSGTTPLAIIRGFMLASAFLSMWVSNTATALMMLPIALSVLSLMNPEGDRESGSFGVALLLGIAYACNIGGMGTLIGTPPNALLAGFVLENHGIEVTFLQWFSMGLPLVVIGLAAAYWILTRVAFRVALDDLPGAGEVIRRERNALERIQPAEVRVGLVFGTAALSWIFRPVLSGWIPGLSDAGIAVAAALVLFLVPSGDRKASALLSWEEARRVPWGILLLFGGGLSLSAAISQTGLAAWLAGGIEQFQGWPLLLIIFLVVTLMVFLTEMTSNTASTATFLPILAAVAVGLGESPLLLAVPTALGASCAFMLPVATPPNAIVYGSGQVALPQMARAGLYLNACFIVLLSMGSVTLFQWIFGR